MAIVLSHITAGALYREALRRMPPIAETDGVSSRVAGASSRGELELAVRQLKACGVDERMLEELHVLVSSQAERRVMRGVVCHVWQGPIPGDLLVWLGSGVYVVDARLYALQAAAWKDDLEFIWQCYELCAAYATPACKGRRLFAREPLTTKRELDEFFAAQSSKHGVVRARKCIRYVRDRARSPMEIALALLVVLPKSVGGLGVRGLQMDVQVPISGAASSLTDRGYLVFDLYIPAAKLDIEYDGRIHNDPRQAAKDAERANVLRTMGYTLINVGRGSLQSRDTFAHAMEAIRREIGIQPKRLSGDFSERQWCLLQKLLGLARNGAATGAEEAC